MTEASDNIPVYKRHTATLNIAGSTPPNRAAKYAYRLYLDNKWPIDFLVIGGNANQQAMKAMGLFRDRVMRISRQAVTVTFAPIRVRVSTIVQGKETSIMKEATAWRTVLTAYDQKIYEIPEQNLLPCDVGDPNG